MEPQKVNLATFAAHFNEDWTVADKEYMPEFYPRFPEFFKKSKKDYMEKWAKREMLTYLPGARPETLLDGFKSVEDAMNHFVYKSGHCGVEHRVGRAWRDLMAGKSIRADQDADDGRTIWYIQNGELVEADPVKNRMKESRQENKFRQDRKEMKVNSYVTKGRAEDYDVEKVVQDLEEPPKKPKKKKKSKKKQLYYLDPKPTEKAEKVESQVESDVPDCTICFCPRKETFMVNPCGHATFCGDCADRILQGTKRSPNCQVSITSTKRIYQNELPKQK